MTEIDVIKALELCNNGICKGCPYYDVERCIAACRRDALNLIKQQQAEIEKLERVISHLEGICKSTLDNVRTEAIKAFAKRLRKRLRFKDKNYPSFVDGAINNVEEEMTEDK